MQETFMGSFTIIPVVKGKGLEPAAAPAGIVSILGNKTGETVLISGIPKNDNFKLLGSLDSDPVVSSGLVAEVVDKRTLKITGFYSMNASAEEMETQVSGTLIRQGPRLATSPKDPIIIRCRLKAVLERIPEDLRHHFIRIKDKKLVTELDPNEMIDLYQIQSTGQITSIL